MAKGMKVVRGDEYEEAAMAFVGVMAVELDVALKDAGITDVKKRRKVVDTFCFGMGNFFDQYWFEAAGKRYFPVLCYSEKHLQDEPGTLGLPEVFDYHEYSADVFDGVTRKGKGPYDVKIGLVGDDEPMSAEELEE